MVKIFAISGKGGTGKTTFTALLIKYLILKKKGLVLAVDADPNSNLNEKLGVKIEQSIGDLREDLIKNADNIPQGFSKVDYVGYQLQQAIVEDEKFDLIAIGRQEGPGCYCYINNILRGYLDSLPEKYEHVLIDNEAGMEHLSRRTTRDVDVLFIVSDASRVGILTAKRISEMAGNLDLKVKKIHLIISRVSELPEQLLPIIKESGFEDFSLIPNDKKIEEFGWTGKPVIEITENSQSFISVSNIVKKLKL